MIPAFKGAGRGKWISEIEDSQDYNRDPVLGLRCESVNCYFYYHYHHCNRVLPVPVIPTFGDKTRIVGLRPGCGIE